MAKVKNKGGRPSKFDDIDLDIVEIVTRKGFTDEEIAKMLKVTVRTFHNWKKENEEFFHSLKGWKDEADSKVERSLYERAKGYIADDLHICVIKEDVVITPIKKHYPPDPTSMIFWLKNRKPKEWRDNVDSGLQLDETELTALKSVAKREIENQL